MTGAGTFTSGSGTVQFNGNTEVRHRGFSSCSWAFRAGLESTSAEKVLLVEEILYQLIYGESTIIDRVLYIPGGCLGFLPSTVRYYFLNVAILADHRQQHLYNGSWRGELKGCDHCGCFVSRISRCVG